MGLALTPKWMVVASVFESEAALELLMVKTMAPVLVAV